MTQALLTYAQSHPGTQELREALFGAVLYINGKNAHEVIRLRGADLRAWRDENLPDAGIRHRMTA